MKMMQGQAVDLQNILGHSTHPAVELLSVLYGDSPFGYRTLWIYQNKTTLWLPANDYEGVAKWVDNLPSGLDAYFGIGLHPASLGPYKRGKGSAVTALPGLWADIDVKSPAHAAENLPATMDDTKTN